MDTHTRPVGCEMRQLLWESLAAPQNVNMRLPHDPEMPLLGTRPRETKTYVHANMCTRTIIAAVSVTDKGGNSQHAHHLM